MFIQHDSRKSPHKESNLKKSDISGTISSKRNDVGTERISAQRLHPSACVFTEFISSLGDMGFVDLCSSNPTDVWHKSRHEGREMIVWGGGTA